MTIYKNYIKDVGSNPLGPQLIFMRYGPMVIRFYRYFYKDFSIKINDKSVYELALAA